MSLYKDLKTQVKQSSTIMDEPIKKIGRIDDKIEGLIDQSLITIDESEKQKNFENPFLKEVNTNKLLITEYIYSINSNELNLTSLKCKIEELDLYSFKTNIEKTEIIEIYKNITHPLTDNFIDNKIDDNYILQSVNTNFQTWIKENIFLNERDSINKENQYNLSASYEYDNIEKIASINPLLDSFYISSLNDYVLKSLPSNFKLDSLSNLNQIEYIIKLNSEFEPSKFSFSFSIRKSNMNESLSEIPFISNDLINNILNTINDQKFSGEYILYKLRYDIESNKFDRISLLSNEEDNPDNQRG